MATKTVQVIIEDVTYNCTYNSSTGYYEANATAPQQSSFNNNDGHYYPVIIKAVDDAGNQTVINDSDETFGSKLRLRVKETTKPVITITRPTESEVTNNAKPTVSWTVTDAGSGVNSGTIGITIDNGNKITSGITKTSISNGFACSYTMPQALSDGTHTIKVDAQDNDGNAATQRTVSFVVDVTPPTLSVTSPVNNLITKDKTVTVAGKTSDITTGIKTVTVKLNENTPQSVSVDAIGNFRTTLTLVTGHNTIVISATDAGGLKTEITRIVTLDVTAPKIKDVTISPNPVNTGGVLKISVKIED